MRPAPTTAGRAHGCGNGSLNQASSSRADGTGHELFFDPRNNQIIGSDSTIYQYNFFIPKAEAFEQQQGNIYWLDVQAMVGGDSSGSGFADFGWKTSLEHFNDDAVHGRPLFPGNPGFWDELRDPTGPIPSQQFHPGFPDGHPLAGQSIDLALRRRRFPNPTQSRCSRSAAFRCGGVRGGLPQHSEVPYRCTLHSARFPSVPSSRLEVFHVR